MSHTPKNAVVWAEIPVSDLKAAVAFYAEVFGFDLKITEDGPNPIAMFPTVDGASVAGHLYPGNPPAKGSGPTVHLAAPDTLEATRDRAAAKGAETNDIVVNIPGGRFCYATDLDGNSFGIFEAA